MAEIFRVNKTGNYTVMSNYHLQDKRLSFKAKGLLSYMLSLPESWNYTVRGLVYVSKEGVKAINSILKELETNHYLIRNRKQKENGRFYYEYNIYEQPYTQKGITELGNTVNDIQINTNIENTKKKDKEDKTITPIIKELIKRKFLQKYDLELYQYEELFNELLMNYPAASSGVSKSSDVMLLDILYGKQDC